MIAPGSIDLADVVQGGTLSLTVACGLLDG